MRLTIYSPARTFQHVSISSQYQHFFIRMIFLRVQHCRRLQIVQIYVLKIIISSFVKCCQVNLNFKNGKNANFVENHASARVRLLRTLGLRNCATCVYQLRADCSIFDQNDPLLGPYFSTSVSTTASYVLG